MATKTTKSQKSSGGAKASTTGGKPAMTKRAGGAANTRSAPIKKSVGKSTSGE